MKTVFGPRNPEEAQVYAVEGLLAETQYCIQRVMNGKKVSRSALAKRLGCTPANVSQMLSEHSNLKLESVARIFHALGDTCIVKSRYLENRKQGPVAANEDNYRLERDWVVSGVFKHWGRISLGGGERGVSSPMVGGRLPGFVGLAEDVVEVGSLDDVNWGVFSAEEEADNYADAA